MAPLQGIIQPTPILTLQTGHWAILSEGCFQTAIQIRVHVILTRHLHRTGRQELTVLPTTTITLPTVRVVPTATAVLQEAAAAAEAAVAAGRAADKIIFGSA